MSTPRSRTARLLPALARGFGVQYWGATYTAEALAAQPHGVLILETTKIGAPYSDTGYEVFFTKEEITAINHGGKRPVLGYLNVSKIESYRDYWIHHTATHAHEEAGSSPQWYGPHAEQGDHLAAYWTDAWKEIVLARVDRMMTSGLDGLFLDDVLQYYNLALDDTLRWSDGERPEDPSGAPGFAVAMMRLVESISTRARASNCDALIIVNNGVFIGRDAAETTATPNFRTVFSSYLDAIDAIMVENLSTPNTHPHTIDALREDYQENGVPVLALDIAAQFPEIRFTELRNVIAKKTGSADFFSYVSSDGSFNQLYPPISRSFQVPTLSE